jgi:hypothetical protein
MEVSDQPHAPAPPQMICFETVSFSESQLPTKVASFQTCVYLIGLVQKLECLQKFLFLNQMNFLSNLGP